MADSEHSHSLDGVCQHCEHFDEGEICCSCGMTMAETFGFQPPPLMVKIPDSVDEAKAMLLIATAWLEEYAPGEVFHPSSSLKPVAEVIFPANVAWINDPGFKMPDIGSKLYTGRVVDLAMQKAEAYDFYLGRVAASCEITVAESDRAIRDEMEKEKNQNGKAV